MENRASFEARSERGTGKYIWLIAKDFLDVKEGPGNHAKIKSRQNRNNDDNT
jgi:hypothetical protein